jgi:hypothetical protein
MQQDTPYIILLLDWYESHYFVDPITGVNTNHIEETWCAICAIKWHGVPIRERTREFITTNLFAFIWKRKNEGISGIE